MLFCLPVLDEDLNEHTQVVPLGLFWILTSDDLLPLPRCYLQTPGIPCDQNGFRCKYCCFFSTLCRRVRRLGRVATNRMTLRSEQTDKQQMQKSYSRNDSQRECYSSDKLLVQEIARNCHLQVTTGTDEVRDKQMVR